jgi:thioredoxin reductase (NADPH)
MRSSRRLHIAPGRRRGKPRRSLRRDEHGFVVTGSDLADGGNPAASWTLPRPPFPLGTSLPGVFAAGDVRHGSVKRVASAVGEGSIATTQVTQYLQQQARS